MTAAPLIALLQAAPEATGGASWTLRNWLGLGCQVVVFILLVAFIFWLADLSNAGPEEEGDGAAKADAGEPETPAVQPEVEPEPTPEAPPEPSEPAPEASSEPPAAPEPPAES